MGELTLIGALAVVIERTVQVIKDIRKDGEVSPWKILSMVLGVVVCVAYGADILGELGFISNLPHLGEVLTGLTISGVGNYLYDFKNKNIDVA